MLCNFQFVGIINENIINFILVFSHSKKLNSNCKLLTVEKEEKRKYKYITAKTNREQKYKKKLKTY